MINQKIDPRRWLERARGGYLPSTEDHVSEQEAVVKAVVAKGRRGWETTEFAFAALVAIGAIVLCAMGKIDVDALMQVLGFATAGYSTARGLAKR